MITLGSSLVFNEEITTDAAGLVQILLLDGTTFTVGPRYSFASPIDSSKPDWTVALNTGALFRSYDEPDPVIDPTSAERDWEAFVGGGLTIPVKPDVALITEMEYRYVDSNYDTRNYDNFSISFSVAKSF